MANFNNVEKIKSKLNKYDVATFNNIEESYKDYLLRIKVNKFRHVNGLEMSFDHPVTVIAGTNKVGKTSLLLLIACSFEEFWKFDSTKPDTVFKKNTWKDVISFTSTETDRGGYSYNLSWRIGSGNTLTGEGKRNAGKRSWTGLGKASTQPRTNAKIKKRHVRFIDLERMLPARSFTKRLNYKASNASQERIGNEIEQMFSYILDIPYPIEIFKTGTHINKRAFLIKRLVDGVSESYSSYNAASGEESLLNMLIDIYETEKNSLILIDELECGIHPQIQRKLADVIQFVSWEHKKQFIITTHSPTLLASFSQKSRKLIDIDNEGNYECVNNTASNTVFSKMDTEAHPLVTMYCEDDLAKYIIRQILIKIGIERKYFDRLINIVISGPINEVKIDYERHKRNYSQLRPRKGFCCVFDGDYYEDQNYKKYHDDNNEYAFFLYPYTAPEKFLITAYLQNSPNQELSTFMKHQDHHLGFSKMKDLGLAVDEQDAITRCWREFEVSEDYDKLFEEFKQFIFHTVLYFSELAD